MTPITISNHPQTSLNIARKAIVEILEIKYTAEVVNLTIRVSHYDALNNPVKGLNDVFPNLRVDNTTMVDQTGTIVANDSPNAVMTEWQFFKMLGSIPIVIDNLCTQKIQWADSLGRLNVY